MVPTRHHPRWRPGLSHRLGAKSILLTPAKRRVRAFETVNPGCDAVQDVRRRAPLVLKSVDESPQCLAVSRDEGQATERGRSSHSRAQPNAKDQRLSRLSPWRLCFRVRSGPDGHRTLTGLLPAAFGASCSRSDTGRPLVPSYKQTFQTVQSLLRAFSVSGGNSVSSQKMGVHVVSDDPPRNKADY